MVFTNIGKSGLALSFAGSMTLPTMCDVGVGSQEVTANKSGLDDGQVTSVFTTRDISTQREVTYTIDFSSITMSGLLFSEFGLRTSGGGLGSGDFFNVDNTTPTQYDGTNELQIQLTYEVF